MVETKIFCDRCQALVVSDRTRLAVSCGPLRAALVGDHDGPAVDLCPGCAGAFLAWIRAPADEEEIHAAVVESVN